MLDKSYAIVITTQVYCSCQEVERNGSFINWLRSLWEEPNCFNKSICMVVLTLHFLLNYTMIKCWQISVSVTYTCLPSLTPSWIRWFMQNLAKIKRLTKVTIMNHWRLYQGGATIVTRTYNEIYSTMERCEFLFQNKTTALKKKQQEFCMSALIPKYSIVKSSIAWGVFEFWSPSLLFSYKFTGLQ